jgi:CRISPR system Cascade subunit CasD
MTEFLAFTLAAQVAAMGSPAVNKHRRTWDRPGRSAVLGLIAGCLGVDRNDETAHQALEADYGLAMRVEQCGAELRDYHTIQVAPPGNYVTRRDELASPKLGTDQSWRYYRTEMHVLLVLWLHEEAARWSLQDIGAAMQQPRFHPYFGRVCCPLSLPLDPVIVTAADPVAALAWRAANDTGLRAIGRLPLSNPVITLDAAAARRFRLPHHRVEMRRDALHSRQRWQFSLRDEAVL